MYYSSGAAGHQFDLLRHVHIFSPYACRCPGSLVFTGGLVTLINFPKRFT